MSASQAAPPAPRAPSAGPPATSPLRALWDFLASIRLLLWCLGIGLIPLIIGTFFIQKPLGQFNEAQEVARLGSGLVALLETFGIYDIYHSWYLQTILVAVAINNICCTIDRFFVRQQGLTSKAVGVIIVHVGVNVVLAGAFYSSRTGVEGFMPVFEGAPPVNIMRDAITQEPIELPFSVQLDDFRLVHYDDPDQRIFVVDAEGDTLQAITFDPARPLPRVVAIGRQDYFSRFLRFVSGGADEQITIEQYYPDARRERVPHPTEDGSGPWLIGLNSEAPGHRGSGFLEAGVTTRRTIIPQRLSVAYVRTTTEAQFAQALASTVGEDEDPYAPRLIVRDSETKAEATYPAEVGAEIALADGAGTVTILEYTPQLGKSASALPPSAEATNPAIKVELHEGDQTRTGWLLGRFSAASGVRGERFALAYRQGPQPGETEHQVDFVAGPGGQRKMVHRRAGRLVAVYDAAPGATIELTDVRARFTVEQYVDGAVIHNHVVNKSDELRNPALQVTYERSGEPLITGWMFEREPLDAGDGSRRLLFARDNMVKEFQSDLNIYKDGRKVVDKFEIIVNRYLDVDGYHIYQASYDQEAQRWSGLSIKRDPGIPTIYSGFTLMFLGMLFLFYVRPLLERRKQGRPLIPEAGSDGMY